jgi:hypothetical protein
MDRPSQHGFFIGYSPKQTRPISSINGFESDRIGVFVNDKNRPLPTDIFPNKKGELREAIHLLE